MKVKLNIADEAVDVYLIPGDEAERRILWFVGKKEGVYEATIAFDGHETNGKARHLRLHFIKTTLPQLENLEGTEASMHGRSLEP